MTDRIHTAKALREQGAKYSAIGEQLGVTRQRAYAMVRQAENLAAFTNVNASQEPTTSGELLGEPSAPPEGGKPLNFEGTRLAFDIAPAGNWTFTKLVQVMDKLRKGYDPLEFYALAEEMLERDSNTRSLLDIRIAQTANQPLVPDVSTSSLLREKKATQAGIDMLLSAGFRDVMPAILAARFNSVCVLELEWELTATARTVKKIHWRDPKNFVFDRQDYRKLWLKPETPGGALVEAPAGRFVVVFANGKPGAPVRSGLALPSAWEYVKKSIAEYDWTKFLNKYGKPAPVLNVPAEGAKLKPQERAELRRLAASLGGDVAAILEGGVTLTYSKDGTVAGSSDAFESKVRYHDEQNTKLMLGGALASGTGNTGSGGSQALGTVHAELRYDLQKSDAQLPMSAANEILRWHAIYNYGENAFIPQAKLELDEPEDKAAARENAKAAHEMGLPLSISKTAEQLGVFLAETPEDTLAAPSTPQPTQSGAALSAILNGGKACPVHQPSAFAAQGPQRDRIDDLADEMLADFEQIGGEHDQAAADIALDAGNLEAAAQQLLAFLKDADVTKLAELLTAARAASGAAGAGGTEV